jgi:hypothetical protein
MAISGTRKAAAARRAASMSPDFLSTRVAPLGATAPAAGNRRPRPGLTTWPAVALGDLDRPAADGLMMLRMRKGGRGLPAFVRGLAAAAGTVELGDKTPCARLEPGDMPAEATSLSEKVKTTADGLLARQLLGEIAWRGLCARSEASRGSRIGRVLFLCASKARKTDERPASLCRRDLCAYALSRRCK